MTALACPRCAHPLREHCTSKILLRGCLTCGGIFLDVDARKVVIAHADDDVVNASDLASQHARWTPSLHQRVSCPVCRQVMHVQRVGAGGFDLDVCDAHGAWFDRDELRTFVRALAAQRSSTPNAKKGRNKAAIAAAAVGGAAVVGTAAVVAASDSSNAANAASAGSGIDAADVVETGASVLEVVFDLLGALAD